MNRKEIFKTATGVQISYRTFGEASGIPIILLYGLLGSSKIPNLWHQKAIDAGVSLFVIDRPGYGASDNYNDLKSVGEWAHFVLPLLDHLQLKTFGVIGISAGAPYALSLAAAFPQRVIGAWIIAGVPNVFEEEILDQYPEESKNSYQNFKKDSLEEIAQQYKISLEELKPQYAETHDMEEILDTILDNNCIGLGREVKMQVKDWEFNPYDIKVPLFFWHAKADEMVPFAAVKKMLEKIPQALLTIQELDSHFPSDETVAQVFESIQCMR